MDWNFINNSEILILDKEYWMPSATGERYLDSPMRNNRDIPQQEENYYNGKLPPSPKKFTRVKTVLARIHLLDGTEKEISVEVIIPITFFKKLAGMKPD